MSSSGAVVLRNVREHCLTSCVIKSVAAARKAAIGSGEQCTGVLHLEP
jgi:hypothetical protein